MWSRRSPVAAAWTPWWSWGVTGCRSTPARPTASTPKTWLPSCRRSSMGWGSWARRGDGGNSAPACSSSLPASPWSPCSTRMPCSSSWYGRPPTWAPCSTTCAAIVRRSPASSDPESPACRPSGGTSSSSATRPLPLFLLLLRTRDERLGRHPGRGGGHAVLAALDTGAAQAAAAARGRPPAPRPGRGAARRARPARADLDPHGALPGGPGGARGAADPAGADLRRAAGGVDRTGAHLGRALDLATGSRGSDAVPARRLGGERRARVPRGRAAGAWRGGRVRRARHGRGEADAQRDGLRVHHPGEAAGRSAHCAALPRETIPRPCGAVAPPGRALEYGAVCVGRGAVPGRSRRLLARAQARLAGADRG